MARWRHWLLAAILVGMRQAAWAAGFTPLVPTPQPALISRVAEYPNGQLGLTNLVDGDLKTDFASLDQGTNTVIEFGFDQPFRIGALRHVDRNDQATVAASEFEFLDNAGQRVALVPVTHVNRQHGETFFILPSAVTARKIRWHITKLGVPSLLSVGGAEMTFYTPQPTEAAPSRIQPVLRVLPFADKAGTQPVKVEIDHPYTTSAEVSLRVGGNEVARARLAPGSNAVEFQAPVVQSAASKKLELFYEGKSVAGATFEQKPVRPMTIYVVPHSHTDIGYTEIQTAIEKKQIRNVADGISAARKTANYPEGSRYVWNVEVGWAADLYLERGNAARREELFDAVRKGQVALNGMYLNELTGLCRPEELIQLFRFGTKMAQETGVPIDTAMISDVPGYTWGTVTALSQAGIKYLSAAPNYFDRIGTILKEAENKPFYWVGPDGKSKVLVWIPFWGYAMSHIYNEMSPKLVGDLFDGLEKRGYPYDIAYVRWAGHGDNAVPDPALSDFIRDWNAKYEWPKFIISAASAPFHALEHKYGAELPTMRGDWSPYWEDGAGSSALETAQNRNSSDQLSAAATAFAMLKPREFPTNDFNQAWRNILLYSEHTWGANCSISGPERKETREQWAIKKSYADNAREQSSALMKKALESSGSAAGGVEVINTLSWPRTQIVTVPAELSREGDFVKGSHGVPVSSQRLRSGELVFLASEIPPFATARFTISAGAAAKPTGSAFAKGNNLNSGSINILVDEKTGAIKELKASGIDSNFVDARNGEGLNDYVYMLGDNPADAKKNGAVRISVGESGPLVASLVIESDAPGCNKLLRELRVVAGQDFVEVLNLVDKARLEAKSYYEKNGKESVNFSFPFNIPDGEMLVDLPLGAFRPEQEQLPGACKNWLTVGRWVEVANKDRGVTWVTLDAPLIEVAELTARLLNSQTNPDVWQKHIPKSQKFYSWAMNNHWGTNYRAYQEGPTLFRYVLRPHGREANPAAATRFATQFSQPLQVRRAGDSPQKGSLLTLSNNDVIVTGLKPSDDGKAVIVRLFGASGKEATTRLNWSSPAPRDVVVSGTAESRGRSVQSEVTVPGYGVVTLRAEF